MLPFWLDGHAAFVFNFNSLNNARPTTNPGERLGLIEVGMPGTDLAMAFETQKKPPLDTPYTYILFYRLIRIGDSLVEQRMTYEEFRAYAEKMGYWQKGWSLFGDKWELNTNDAWKDGKK
jgi:hypothetical protein